VRVKVNGAIADMYAKYYGPGVNHDKVPHLSILQHTKHMVSVKNIWIKLQKIMINVNSHFQI